MSAWKRLILWVLTAQAGFVGVWATALPRSFYDHFPGWGHVWVAGAGPYSEHLVRDVGALSLALGVLTAGAAARPRWVHPAACAAAWLIYSAPHLIYHIRSDTHLAQPDRWLSHVALGLQVALPLVLLVPQGRSAYPGPLAVGVTGSRPDVNKEGELR
ncbi:MAG TPA: hypothetical protein VFY84_02445 [Jiangellales bacterium]|nr:hypothetical protein [Jiangellales bacterium]